MIHFGNAFAVVLSKMVVASTKQPLTSATGTAQLKTSAGATIGDAVSLVHEGGGTYRGSFPESYFTDHAAELASGKLITIEIIGTSPAFRFDIVQRVRSRG